ATNRRPRWGHYLLWCYSLLETGSRSAAACVFFLIIYFVVNFFQKQEAALRLRASSYSSFFSLLLFQKQEAALRLDAFVEPKSSSGGASRF
ncbi:hypothetical protein, partial [Dyadobacter sp. CY323]|uniref:hypothetical protein n=1 Tax=Dyadobacter sp. CY323 TaxID=2907302 RepID=UPI001F1C5D94